jgi:hypothetical protein
MGAKRPQRYGAAYLQKKKSARRTFARISWSESINYSVTSFNQVKITKPNGNIGGGATVPAFTVTEVMTTSSEDHKSQPAAMLTRPTVLQSFQRLIHDHTAAKIFRDLDVDGKGRVSMEQLKQGLSKHNLGFKDADIVFLFDILDTDRSGMLSLNQFELPACQLSEFSMPGSKPYMAQPSILASIGLSGIASVIAVNFIHPIELVKTRVQVSGEPAFSTAAALCRNEGYAALFKGINSAWVREGTYTAIKMGAYAPLRDAMGGGGTGPNAAVIKFTAGCITGAAGSAVSNPFDVLKTMQMANQREAVNVFGLARSLYHEQGIGGFYRGLQTNVVRATVNNGVKFAAYDVCKDVIEDTTGWSRADSRNYLLSSVVCSFCMAVAISPFDMIRTQLMNQPVDRKIYNGMSDCAAAIVKKDGVFAFYRGFMPLYARMLPATILQLGIFEALLKVAGYNAV